MSPDAPQWSEAPEGHAYCYDLGTPRLYTQHGNWNTACECGVPFGDGPTAHNDWIKHVDEVLLSGQVAE